MDNKAPLCYQASMSISEIKAMSREEQLLAMEMLWNELCHQVEEPVSPAWHKDVLENRAAKVAEGTAEYLTLDEVKKRLRRHLRHPFRNRSLLNARL